MDESFTSIIGEEVSVKSIVQKMIDYYNRNTEINNLTDFNEGSVIRNLSEANSSIIYHLEFQENSLLKECFISTADGSYLDLFGKELGIIRDNASKSQGVVTFSIANPVNYAISIPQFTRFVDKETGLFFETWTTSEIPAGQTSVNCPVYSVIEGDVTNILANSNLVFYNDYMFNGVSISNDDDFTGGSDTENDEDYRNRLLEAKKIVTQGGFGSKPYYVKLGRIKGVHDIYLAEDEHYTATVIVNGFDDEQISDKLLEHVRLLYTTEKNILYRDTFNVIKAQFTNVNLELKLIVSDTLREEDIKRLIRLYFNGGKLMVNGQSFNCKGCSVNSIMSNYELMTFIESIDGVKQVTSITRNGGQFNKLTPDENTVLRLGNLNIEQTIG